MGNKSGPKNPDHTLKNFFADADLGSGMEKIRIRDKHPGSATLFDNIYSFLGGDERKSY